jgi:hypothetical protein
VRARNEMVEFINKWAASATAQMEIIGGNTREESKRSSAGASQDYAPYLRAFSGAPVMLQHALIFAALETGKLELCKKILCGEASLLETLASRSRLQDDSDTNSDGGTDGDESARDCVADTIRDVRSRHKPTLSSCSSKREQSLPLSHSLQRQRNVSAIVDSRSLSRSDNFLGKLLRSSTVTKMPSSLSTGFSASRTSYANRESYAFAASLRLKSPKTSDTPTEFSADEASMPDRVGGSSGLSSVGRFSNGLLQMAADASEVGMMADLSSPHAILSTLHSDPLVLAPALHICVLRGDYISAIQVGTVALSYLDIERPASMVLPRFHAFTACATAVAMGFFGYLGRASKYAGTKTKGITLPLEGAAEYRKRLKLIVHKLEHYGAGMDVTRAHVMFMRGWWRLARGYVSKALGDFRPLAPTVDGRSRSDGIRVPSMMSAQIVAIVTRIRSTSNRAGKALMKTLDRGELLESVLLAKPQGS